MLIMPTAKMMVKAKKKRQKVTILYATETGKSQAFAVELLELFDHAFDGKVSANHTNFSDKLKYPIV